ncbi:hypothetical protein M5J15_15270 [Serratia symbiotica]|uniref:hypothetical protein n=1 Tax=Serratia symbiotica TaxID=138074 RepID=UPI002091E1E7|nr:hypothetical protein [Serratia symbiotica]USS95638.1 hypothetical protein M5J15_15270 [Serratia symbiotica]
MIAEAQRGLVLDGGTQLTGLSGVTLQGGALNLAGKASSGGDFTVQGAASSVLSAKQDSPSVATRIGWGNSLPGAIWRDRPII